MEFGELVRQAKDFVLKHGGHPTLLVANGEKGREYIYLPDFPSSYEEKILYLFGAGKQAAKLGSVGVLTKVFLVMEAWQGRNINIRPSQDPNRIEVLVVSCLDVATKEQSITCLEYVRDASGILREIKDMVRPDSGESRESTLASVCGWLYSQVVLLPVASSHTRGKRSAITYTYNWRLCQESHKRVSLSKLSLCFDSEQSEPSKRQETVFAPPGAGPFSYLSDAGCSHLIVRAGIYGFASKHQTRALARAGKSKPVSE